MKRYISHLIDRGRNVPLPMKAAFWFTLCGFAQRGVSMITTPIFTRVLPENEYGIYSTFLSWEAVFVIITTFSLYKSMMNLYVSHDNRKHVLSAICSFELLLTVTWLIAGVLLRNQFSKILGIPSILVCCLFINCFYQAVFQCWSLDKRYNYDYKPVVFVTIVATIGVALLSLLAVLRISSTAVSRGLSSSIVFIIIGLFICYLIYRDELVFYDGEIWKFSALFSISLMPHYLSEFILQSSDKIMINYLCGSKDVALYSVAYSVGSIITIMSTAINSSFAPYQYQRIKEKEYKTLAKVTNFVLLLLAIILFLLMLFSREIVLIFGGIKYIDSSVVVVPICIGVYFNYTFQLFARVQEYYFRKLAIIVPSILCAILNIILNYIFINKYGYQAAAFTTFFCYSFFCFIHYLSYRKLCINKLNGIQIYNVKGILGISILVIIFGVISQLLVFNLFLKWIFLLLTIIVAFVNREHITEKIRMITSRDL